MTRFTRRRWFGFLPFAAALTWSTPVRAAKDEVPDDLLIDHVNRRLVTDPRLGIRPLEVAVQDGKVTVTGFVPNEKLRKRVDKVVKKVKGVREVDNQVRVRR